MATTTTDSNTSSSMIRRRTHARSKKGCLTCKERHVRCDERLPYCGNCLRLGRECSYTQVLPQTCPNDVDKQPPASFQASEQAWLTKISPRDFQMYYCPPHHRDIPSSTISVIQQAQEISRRRPMPRSCLLTIAQHYTPKYNLLAAEHECVKHAIVSFAAYMHFQATKSQISQEVCIQHIGSALRQLQKDILTFGPNNSDAVVTASIFLAGTAQDWLISPAFYPSRLADEWIREQWAVFVDGYSKALTQIILSKLRTVYPDFCGSSFQLRSFSLRSNLATPPLPANKLQIRTRVKLVLDSIFSASCIFGLQKWREAEFEALEKLANSVDAALAAESDDDTYHQLAWLRSWLFWMDLRKANTCDEQVLLGALFYALVLTVVPLFPARYAESLVEVGEEKIRRADLELRQSEGKWEEFGLLKLVEDILPNF
ncbi:uncharacterized protein PAC_19169 [Phialocephala subalpina]|uniref:Zn(2)-C6 fungal-type domain-containing protein n=1 Tax=Phialocephala subalpina TaxID=576137 RepID=A0A1L7XWA3_9HELO|nr:uncharacterized protein PAC_19169 [Phialocephala subalpina]